MAHVETNANLSPEEKMFNDYMTRANDFVKIEIYRNAVEWYTKALELNIDNTLVNEKLELCKQLISKERKTIIAVLIAAAIAVGVVFMIVSM